MAEISLNKTRIIIRSALAKGAELGLKPLSVVVLDAGGHVKGFERQDNAAPGRFKIAHGKAYGAVMLWTPGESLRSRAEEQAYFVLAANGAFDGQLIPVPGGVLVKNAKGTVIGAVGVSGDSSENDEICAVAGIEAAKLVPEP